MPSALCFNNISDPRRRESAAVTNQRASRIIRCDTPSATPVHPNCANHVFGVAFAQNLDLPRGGLSRFINKISTHLRCSGDLPRLSTSKLQHRLHHFHRVGLDSFTAPPAHYHTNSAGVLDGRHATWNACRNLRAAFRGFMGGTKMYRVPLYLWVTAARRWCFSTSFVYAISWNADDDGLGLIRACSIGLGATPPWSRPRRCELP